MQPESRLVKKIRRYLWAEGAWSAKIHGSDEGFQEIGLPDLFVCWRGRFIALEAKQPGKQASPRQLHVIDRIRDAGGIAEVVESVEDVAAILTRLSRVEEGDLQYIAGFFDGEGCISISTINSKRYPKVQIFQAESGVLEWIQGTLGYGLVRQRKPSLGRKATKNHYIYKITKLHEVKDFIELVRPYSRLAHRHRQMDLAYPLACSISRRTGIPRK